MFALDHDYHIHTTLSTCCHDENMDMAHLVPVCRELGRREIVITNHFWDNLMPGADEWYAPQDLAHNKRILPFTDEPDMKIRFGCETECCGGRKIGISPEHYDEFEFIIVPFTHLHNNFSRPVDCTTPEQVAALYMDHFEDLTQLDLPWKKVGIAHLTVSLVYPGENLYRVLDALDSSRIRACLRFMAQHGAGIELNAGCFSADRKARADTFMGIYRIAKEEGCKFYCGSDAHAIRSLNNIDSNIPWPVEALGLDDTDRYRIPD